MNVDLAMGRYLCTSHALLWPLITYLASRALQCQIHSIDPLVTLPAPVPVAIDARMPRPVATRINAKVVSLHAQLAAVTADFCKIFITIQVLFRCGHCTVNRS